MAKVLLVDDHADVGDVVKQLLEMSGHQVDVFQNGESAIQFLAGGMPDAVIADHRLPGMSGIELLRHIRQDPQLNNLTVIICSADDSSRREAEKAGASAFWLKGSDALFDNVQRLGEQLK